MHTDKATRFGSRNWIVLLIVGLFGQIAWTIENMYLNVFVYETITDNPQVIATMVAASAIVATLTTLIMGSLSDRVAKRKRFITFGYLLWGVATMAFAYTEPDALITLFPGQNSVQLAIFAVVLVDCIMTFFGSTANDAAFNAWTTDVSNPQNRGRVQGVLSVLPLISMLLVFGALDPLTQDGNWRAFFFMVGGATILAGLLSLLLMRDPVLQRSDTRLWRTIAYGFKKTTIQNHLDLYMSFLALLIASIATQIYMPYLIIYIQNYLHINDYALLLAITLITASLISVLAGRLIDRYGKRTILKIATLIQLLGLVSMAFARTLVAVAIAGTIMIGGFMVVLACINGLIQDHLPEGMAGRFQGIRMIFAVLLPMVIGPFIGATVIQNSNETYSDLGVTKQVPTPAIFIAAAVVLLCLIIPIIRLDRLAKKER